MTGWLKSVAFVLALLMPFSSIARALDTPPDKFEQKLKEYDPAAVEAARSYARTFDMKGTMSKSIPAIRDSMLRDLKAKNPKLSDEQLTVFFDAFLQSALVDSAPLIEQATILIMLDVLSEEEIVALDQFYSSPVGVEILKKLPVFLGRVPEVMTLMQIYIIPRALDAARDKMKENGVDVRI